MLYLAVVIHKNCPGNDWGRCDPTISLDYGFHAIASQHLECCALSQFGEGVCVFPQINRTLHSMASPVVTDCQGDGEDVRLGESTIQRRSPMPARAESD